MALFTLSIAWSKHRIPTARGIGEVQVPDHAIPTPQSLPDLKVEVVEASGSNPSSPHSAFLANATALLADATVQLQGKTPLGMNLWLCVFDSESGARLQSQEIAAGTLPRKIEFPDLPAGQHRLALACSKDSARSSYLNSSLLVAGKDEPTPLSAQMFQVTVHLQPAAKDIPVILRRLNDPLWRACCSLPPGQRLPLPLTNADGVIALPALGVGHYSIQLESYKAADPQQLLFELRGDDKPEVQVTITGAAQ